MSAAAACWHCGLPAPDNSYLAHTPDGDRPTCCSGCAAAVEMVHQLGFSDYYRLRSRTAPVADKKQAEHVLALFAMPALLDPYLSPGRDNPALRRLRLQLGDIHCAACCWLIEKVVLDLPGIHLAQVNLATMQLTLEYDPALPGVAEEAVTRVLELGYDVALPGDPQRDQRLAQENRRMLGRLILAGIGAMQAMMYGAFLYLDIFDGDAVFQDVFRLTSMVISTPVVFYAGWPFFQGAFRGLRHRHLTMDVPIALALALAWFGSVANIAWGGTHSYFESASMFVFFLLISRTIELKQQHRIQRAWQRLQDTLPRIVRRLEGGNSAWVSAREIQPGDILLMTQGETVPVDVTVLEGEAEVSEAALTGESVPVHVATGQLVQAGAKLLEGHFNARAEGTVDNSLVAQIAEQVSQASDERLEIVRDWQKVAPVFILFTLILAAATLAIHWSSGPGTAFSYMLALLVVTCPCALALAVPMAMSATLSTALREGLLIASPRQLLAIPRLRGVMFDKTGTLTQGSFHITEVEDLGDAISLNERLRLVAALERDHPHPLARAFDGQDTATDVTELRMARHGASGTWRDARWTITGAPQHARPGTTCLELSRDGSPSLRLWLADELRPEAAQVIQQLRRHRLQVRLASGDAKPAVESVATQLHLDGHRGEMTPQQKAHWLTQLEQLEGPQMMIGDGINDAPALLAASVAVAPGNATSLARRAAGIYLLGDSLRQLPSLPDLSRRCRHTVYQNLAWTALYNIVAIPLAMGGYIAPWAAAIGMASSSLIVTLNANRINKWKASSS
ncbi:heavy metal translocating P-type ATPase [Isoalcanivorax beigongshangi]|uniref:Heavy metal translocating P-type ATPase n=1 Tax=Isoalcanivorax beigongshangi TaxID=3238810 RepID=A0ABV4AKH2_9GAMM